MGYTSDVRIRLTKKDYEKLRREFEKKVPELDKFDLFKTSYFVEKEVKDVLCWKVTDDGEDIEETHDCVFFGWNGVKWNTCFEDVKFIMNFMYDCEYYAFCRIGESFEGDIEATANNMDSIGFYYAFDEEEE